MEPKITEQLEAIAQAIRYFGNYADANMLINISVWCKTHNIEYLEDFLNVVPMGCSKEEAE